MTFSQHLTDCDGSKPAIVSALNCSIPITILRAANYSLPWGSSVFAQVVATNIYGDSATSNPGNGAIILTIPDAPTSIVEIMALKSGKTISLSWADGSKDGGSPVIDYRISYNSNGTTTYDILVSSLKVKSYTASELTEGKNYTFVIQSRNEFDYSQYSTPCTSLAGWRPYQPVAPTTSVIGNQLLVQWSAPFENGSPLISYSILI